MRATTLMAAAFSVAAWLPMSVRALEVDVTPTMSSVEVMHNGAKVTVKRNQDQKNTIKKAFAKTGKCPPFSFSRPRWHPWRPLPKSRCWVTCPR